METTEGTNTPSTSESMITSVAVGTSTIAGTTTAIGITTERSVITTAEFGTMSTTERALPSCQASPCLNGATCIDFTGGYVCLCANGWTGPMCQTGEKVICVDCCLYSYLGSYAWMVQSGS